MHIAYIISTDISVPSGILKKIESKIKYWKKFGYTVSVISLQSSSMVSLIEGGIILSKKKEEKFILNKFLNKFIIAKKLKKCLDEINPDIIYIRFISGSPTLVPILTKYAPYIVEINTNDIEEFKSGKTSRYIINLLTRNYLLKNAKAFVSVSHELMSNDVFTKFKKDFIVIGNGYDFKNVINKKQFFNDNLKFIFIGTPNQPWHGTDKILMLADNLKQHEFHIVGPTKNDLNNNIKIGDNVIFHGYCNSSYLEELIPQCDIGISTLALHRNNMEEASPLKSREYLAYGLPIIIGYYDTDLLPSFQYALNIGNYENNIIDNISEIDKFISFCSSINPSKVIATSEKYLDYEAKEKVRIDFISQYLKKS